MGSLDRMFREVLEGFAGGYNLYVRQHRDTLPPWVPEITGADALALTHADTPSDVASPALVRALQQKYPDGTAAPAAPQRSDDLLGHDAALGNDDGSNALALAGSRTASGAAILLGNPHLRWEQLYWEAHVKVPGRLDFYGSTLVGFPWLRAGFNDRLGYVQTNNTSDNWDVFTLPLDPARPDHYLFEGQSRPLVRVDVAVEVKQDTGTLTTERRTYWRSHLGPIVHRNATTAFAFRSTRADAWKWFEGFWRLSHARSLRDYMKTMSTRFSPESNYTYADADGNIFYLWNSRIPRRVQDGTSYELDVPGGTRKYVWADLHPTKDLPQLLNPAGGYIQNANNPPWFVSLRQKLDPARYPAYFERGELALRAQLALDMLEAREKFSVEDVKRFKFETRLLLAERVKPALLAAIDARPAPAEELVQARAVLGAWDDRASAASRGAVLFQRFWETYRAEVRQPYEEAWDAARPTGTPRGIADVEAALKRLTEAVRWTRATYGAADVAWGDANRYRFGDIDLPGEGASGQLGAYRVQQYDTVAGKDGSVRIAGWAEADRELAGSGDGWVLIVHFTRPMQAYSVLAYGETTDRASPHSRDQIRIFANRELRPAWYTDAEVTAHLEREYCPERGRVYLRNGAPAADDSVVVGGITSRRRQNRY
jgi:acyl-homoserine-lactone acylase